MKKKDEFVAHAFKAWSNHGGVEIQVSDDGDMIRYRYYDTRVSKWQVIKYDKEGNPYFRVGNIREKLDEYMRVL